MAIWIFGFWSCINPWKNPLVWSWVLPACGVLVLLVCVCDAHRGFLFLQSWPTNCLACVEMTQPAWPVNLFSSFSLCLLSKHHWRAATGDPRAPPTLSLFDTCIHAFWEIPFLTCKSDGPRARTLNRPCSLKKAVFGFANGGLTNGDTGELCECAHCGCEGTWWSIGEILRSLLSFSERRGDKMAASGGARRVAFVSAWTVWKLWMETLLLGAVVWSDVPCFWLTDNCSDTAHHSPGWHLPATVCLLLVSRRSTRKDTVAT